MIVETKALGPETSSLTTGRPIIILGMARSGTSLVGDLVHRWGAYGGDVKALKRSNIANPKGFFENPEMQRFIVTRLGLDFWNPKYPERLREKAQDPECRRKAQELVASMTAQGPLWFWKEPYLSVTLPFWKQIWGDAVYVIPVRNPYDTAISWHKHRLPPDLRELVRLVSAGLLEWQYFLLCILEEMEEVPHKIFLSYEGLSAAPREHCQRVCDFLDEHRGKGLQLPGDRLERMVAAVDPSLHRNNGGGCFSDRPEATQVQKDLYQTLLRKIEDPDLPFDPAPYPLYEGWSEYLGNIHFFSQFVEEVVYPLKNSRWVKLGMVLSAGMSRLKRSFRRRK